MADLRDGKSEATAPGATVRRLLRRAGQAALATHLARGGSGWPYASLVLLCVDHDASPLLLLSDLAEHSRNLAADPRAALLIEPTVRPEDPLSEPRASLLGRLAPVDGAALARQKVRFLARHPAARLYADFADFRLHRMAIERAHLVAGFGRIHWLPAESVAYPVEDCLELAEAEPEILAHVNESHANALMLMAERLAETKPQGGQRWEMTGIDPEGLDLRCGAELARVDFPRRVTGPAAARQVLTELVGQARGEARD